MRIGIIADVHSNAPALAAVLEVLGKASCDQIVQLGDALNGPIDPPEVATLLRTRPMRHVRGNGDRMVGAEPGAPISKSAKFARQRLVGTDIDWVRGWPLVQRGEDWRAFHGTSRLDSEYLFEDVRASGVGLRTNEAIEERLGDGPESLLLCGHSHLPRLLRLPRGRVVVNPGSVGLPAYTDDLPLPHKIESGAPHARFAIAEKLRAGWHVALHALPYDWEAAAKLAEANGFPEWARALRTGYV